MVSEHILSVLKPSGLQRQGDIVHYKSPAVFVFDLFCFVAVVIVVAVVCFIYFCNLYQVINILDQHIE